MTKDEEDYTLNHIESSLTEISEAGILCSETPFQTVLRLKRTASTYLPGLRLLIQQRKDMEISNNDLTKQIDNMQNLIDSLCQLQLGWADESDKMLYNSYRRKVLSYASKQRHIEKIKAEYDSLREQLSVFEQDYPELKK